MTDGGKTNIKKWIVLYPVYINSKKTIAEGRRICATKACENPTCVEIGDCCAHLKIPFALEVSLLSIKSINCVSFCCYSLFIYSAFVWFVSWRLTRLIPGTLCKEEEWGLCWKRKTAPSIILPFLPVSVLNCSRILISLCGLELIAKLTVVRYQLKFICCLLNYKNWFTTWLVNEFWLLSSVCVNYYVLVFLSYSMLRPWFENEIALGLVLLCACIFFFLLLIFLKATNLYGFFISYELNGWKILWMVGVDVINKPP